MTQSMTAFASQTGAIGQTSWAWEMRGVNARGLDLRMRIPEGLGALEAHIRKTLSAQLARGNVTVNLRLTHDDAATKATIDQSQLDIVLGALDQVQERAFEMGVTLAQPNAADVLSQRGVLVAGKVDNDTAALDSALQDDFATLIASFKSMRANEGKALHGVVSGQLDHIATLVEQAETAASARGPAVKQAFEAAVAKIMETADVDEGRIAQELAVLAIKADITEEIDRLKAHVSAARALLNENAPSGRKLDFLAQEFNREANTLCSKAGSTELTNVGLSLKSAIEQMREQIQNVE